MKKVRTNYVEELDYGARVFWKTSALNFQPALSLDEIEECLSDEKLYSTFERENYCGYNGLRKSNRATAAEECHQFPISKWNKEKILDLYFHSNCIAGEIVDSSADDFDILQPENGTLGFEGFFMKILMTLSDKFIQENLLDYCGWHHVNAFAKPVNYYGLKSPKEIFEILREKNKIDFSNFKERN